MEDLRLWFTIIFGYFGVIVCCSCYVTPYFIGESFLAGESDLVGKAVFCAESYLGFLIAAIISSADYCELIDSLKVLGYTLTSARSALDIRDNLVCVSIAVSLAICLLMSGTVSLVIYFFSYCAGGL
jgi:hypothetical protein